MSKLQEINLDPRMRRTRLLLQQALSDLLDTREFDSISVQDITEAATINRATFYAHYADKFALLECVIASKFDQFLVKRAGQFDSTCDSALANVVLAVSDYLIYLSNKSRDKQIQPHIELAVVAVIKRMLLSGVKKHHSSKTISPEMVASTVSWAIYGAVREWAQTAKRSSSEVMVSSVIKLVKPILNSVQA
jgi:AcrR family transcriptional regulator